MNVRKWIALLVMILLILQTVLPVAASVEESLPDDGDDEYEANAGGQPDDGNALFPDSEEEDIESGDDEEDIINGDIEEKEGEEGEIEEDVDGENNESDYDDSGDNENNDDTGLNNHEAEPPSYEAVAGFANTFFSLYSSTYSTPSTTLNLTAKGTPTKDQFQSWYNDNLYCLSRLLDNYRFRYDCKPLRRKELCETRQCKDQQEGG